MSDGGLNSIWSFGAVEELRSYGFWFAGILPCAGELEEDGKVRPDMLVMQVQNPDWELATPFDYSRISGSFSDDSKPLADFVVNDHRQQKELSSRIREEDIDVETVEKSYGFPDGIEFARVEDVADIAAVYEDVYGGEGRVESGLGPYPWPAVFEPKTIEAWINGRENEVIVAKENGKVVGAIVLIGLGPNRWEEGRLVVLNSHRDKKWGSKLVEALHAFVDAQPISVMDVEAVTHSVRSQASNINRGNRVCGLRMWPYPAVFHPDHRESVVMLSRLSGWLIEQLLEYRTHTGDGTADFVKRFVFDWKSKDFLEWLKARGYDLKRRLRLSNDGETEIILAELVETRVIYLPREYHEIAGKIFEQFDPPINP